MIAEGYYASRCIFEINQEIGAYMPIAQKIYMHPLGTRAYGRSFPGTGKGIDLRRT